jgi:hypothetical protein
LELFGSGEGGREKKRKSLVHVYDMSIKKTLLLPPLVPSHHKLDEQSNPSPFHYPP